MKAIIFPEYGSPDVLQIQQIEKPTPVENEVLVKVHAASANPADWHRMRGEPFLARIEEGLFKPQNPKIGTDVAGVVEAVGNKVTEFKVGDAVFGDTFQLGYGTFAEYVCVPENRVVRKPDHVSFEEASAVPLAAATALQGLQGYIQSGQQVLINGAAGGIGTFAVQIAKSFGAEVTGVCSTRNLEMVRSIGADYVVDYTQADFTNNGQLYDLIYDTVGNRSVSDYKRALKPNGRCLIAGFTTIPRLLEHNLVGAWASWRGDKKVGHMGTVAPNKKDLMFLKDLLETGKMTSVIDRCYPFSETAEAIRYLEQGHARGKVVVTVA